MPRNIIPKACACGCRKMTKGGKFVPGHDTKVYRAILQHIDGDILDLKQFVEVHSGSVIVVNHDEIKSDALSITNIDAKSDEMRRIKPDLYFDDNCRIYYLSSVAGKNFKASKRRLRLEAIEAALKDRPLKWKEAIAVANKVSPGAAGKRLLFIGVGKGFWGIENIDGTRFKAEFFDKNGHISRLELVG